MCHQRSGAIENNPPLTYHLSRPLFYLARALKNNHPGHAPLLPIISLIYTHLSLYFHLLLCVFLPSSLPLIVFVFFCPCHCFALAMYFSLFLLSCSPHLTLSSYISLLLIPVLCSLPCLFHQLPPLHMAKNAQSRSLKSQPNRYYPTPSFYPLITHSTPLG